MAKDDTQLLPMQLRNAQLLDKTLGYLANLKEECKQYKLNDIYIRQSRYGLDEDFDVEETALGFPVKYKVVYISPMGVPYLRKITHTGNATGDAFIPGEAPILRALMYQAQMGTQQDNAYNERFVPDPDALDAILLQEEFDPMAAQKEKSKLYNEINKHNKKVQIPTDYKHYHKIGEFFKSLKAGDKFWTSPEKQFIIQSVVKNGKQWDITATDVNQATVVFNFSRFFHKRLYKERPRSFSKESKL